ncbi:Gmad2 immunoglobulin-like domain-containing protein [Nocardioides panacisoli]|uniref:Gmad2 immunoglobulin-like domain-containing protein n=1 Tax=Nocardioides panacisoli TaxID=627624 RepID=UPI001C631B94|nr:Gmad2 immunoglobulin-like domain-containing protein [Nocardioides panacisoli]QYJ04654.1 Gmad2 immunoglobulin-like domain-containing protein [Nocardioides panacisoli]
MRRTSFPALVLTGLLAAATLTGCGDDEPATDPTASDSASSPTSEATPEETETTEATEQPTEDSGVRESDNITLDKPAEGATVSGRFTASGTANSPEANVPWQVLDADGATVLEGFATAEGWMDRLYPWRTKVDVSSLDAGTYTFVAMTSDPSGGAEGNGAEEVRATIVVE